MKSNDVLVSAWEKTLAQRKDAPAILTTNAKVTRTFGEIEEQARAFDTSINTLSAGSVVAIQVGNHDDWPSILLACLRRGVVALPLEQSISGRQRDAVLEICHASAVVAAKTFGANPEVLPPKTPATATDWDGKPPSLLKLTSGTTAVPRAIRFRGEQLLADSDQICDTMGISQADLNFGVISVSHSYGFSNLLTPLITRGVAMVLSSERTPRAVLADLVRTKATVFPGMPVFYQSFCELERVPPLPRLRLCISAGAPLPVSIAEKFRAKFGLPIHSFYGASECGGICYDRDAANDTEGFVGPPMRNIDVKVVDPTADSSQIRVRSAAVGDGYFPESDEGKLGCGIFVPDDLLIRGNAGFRIVGRVSDVINVAGKKVNPAEVEARLLAFRGVRQAVAFGRPPAVGAYRNEEVAACVVADAGVREQDLLEFCRRGLSGWQAPKRIFIVDTIPGNERGKISRRELARRFTS